MTTVTADDAQKFLTLASACDVVAKIYFGDIEGQQELIASLAGDPVDHDGFDFAVLHHQLFALNIFPFANVYTGDDLMAGGELGTELTDLYADAAFVPPGDVTPDHFGVQFQAASHLLLTAVEHWRHGNQPQLQRALAGLERLTCRGILPALIPVTASLACMDQTFPVNFSQIARALGAELAACARSADNGTATIPPEDETAGLPPVDSRLEDLVRFLLTPNRCGFWLAAGDIRTLAAGLGLPCGFSTREDMLTNLLHAAGTYGQVPQLLEAITQLVEQRRETLCCWHLEGRGSIIEPIVQQSERRLKQTMHLLEQFRQHANHGNSYQ
jgi:hypothetical protein